MSGLWTCIWRCWHWTKIHDRRQELQLAYNELSISLDKYCYRKLVLYRYKKTYSFHTSPWAREHCSVIKNTVQSCLHLTLTKKKDRAVAYLLTGVPRCICTKRAEGMPWSFLRPGQVPPRNLSRSSWSFHHEMSLQHSKRCLETFEYGKCHNNISFCTKIRFEKERGNTACTQIRQTGSCRTVIFDGFFTTVSWDTDNSHRWIWWHQEIWNENGTQAHTMSHCTPHHCLLHRCQSAMSRTRKVLRDWGLLRNSMGMLYQMRASSLHTAYVSNKFCLIIGPSSSLECTIGPNDFLLMLIFYRLRR